MHYYASYFCTVSVQFNDNLIKMSMEYDPETWNT